MQPSASHDTKNWEHLDLGIGWLLVLGSLFVGTYLALAAGDAGLDFAKVPAGVPWRLCQSAFVTLNAFTLVVWVRWWQKCPPAFRPSRTDLFWSCTFFLAIVFLFVFRPMVVAQAATARLAHAVGSVPLEDLAPFANMWVLLVTAIGAGVAGLPVLMIRSATRRIDGQGFSCSEMAEQLRLARTEVHMAAGALGAMLSLAVAATHQLAAAGRQTLGYLNSIHELSDFWLTRRSLGFVSEDGALELIPASWIDAYGAIFSALIALAITPYLLAERHSISRLIAAETANSESRLVDLWRERLELEEFLGSGRAKTSALAFAVVSPAAIHFIG
jgi:hypothetical protein